MTEISDLSDTDALNTEVSGETISGNTNMTRTDDVFHAVLGMLSRWRNASIFRLRDDGDNSKQVAFDLSNISASTTRTLTVPDEDGTIALTSQLGANNSPVNLSITATVNSNALTIAIKGFDGNDPSAANPVYIPFRSVTANSGDVEVLTLTAATSFVVSSGSTLGTTSAVAATLTVIGFNDGGTFRLGIINGNGQIIADGIASSTAEGGAGAADAANVFYTGTAVTSKAYSVLGYLTITEATAGTWATAPTVVQTGAAPATALATMPFTKEYISAEQAITLGGSLSISHGLGGTPKITQYSLKCVVPELGYSVGDEVQCVGTQFEYTRGVDIAADATTINVLYKGAGGTVFSIRQKSSNTMGNIDTGNWRLIVRAWA
ncbi:hypothetical protein ACFOOL_14890 [Devosia honganensis]|uniref:Ubiquitin-activating enzyme E1 FCCH domain-containing protein n=1 Tax=Devosia honganensis TaxID=1610527 RepID=A0ABV7X3W7_9HYPH